MAGKATAIEVAAAPGTSALRAYVQMSVVILVWSGYFVVAKKAVGEASPLALSAGRYMVGSLVLGAVAVRMGLPRLNRRQALLVSGMGASSVFGFNLLSFAGLDLALASDAALVMPTVPTLFVVPLATVLFRERIGRYQVMGLALLVLGEVLVFRETIFSEEFDGDRALGIACFFGAAFLWAIYTLCARAVVGLDPVPATFYAVAFGTLLLVPVGGYSFVREAAEASPGFAAAILYLGVLQTVVGLVWWYEGIQIIGASKAAILNTLVPVVALALGAIFLSEAVSLERAAGGALVVAGVIVASTLRARPLVAGPD